MKTKHLKRKQKAQPGGSLEPVVGRGDHEMISFHGRLIPVLGKVGGTAEESRETARNIERFMTANDLFRRKDFRLSPYWPTNAELAAAALNLPPGDWTTRWDIETRSTGTRALSWG